MSAEIKELISVNSLIFFIVIVLIGSTADKEGQWWFALALMVSYGILLKSLSLWKSIKEYGFMWLWVSGLLMIFNWIFG